MIQSWPEAEDAAIPKSTPAIVRSANRLNHSLWSLAIASDARRTPKATVHKTSMADLDG